MTPTAARFVWHELMTSDAKAAAAFYTAVLGWTTKSGAMPEFDYTLASAGGPHCVAPAPQRAGLHQGLASACRVTPSRCAVLS